MSNTKYKKFIEIYNKIIINNNLTAYADLLEEMWYNFSDEEQKQINILIKEQNDISTKSNRTP